MERFSDIAIEIIDELHTERIDYESEYLPLINCANQLSAYEDTGLMPEEVKELVPKKHGKWVEDCMKSRTVDGVSTFIHLVYCSECGEVSSKKTNYCPNCGARMELKG